MALAGLVSCMEIDNFEAPSAKVEGRIIDKTTGQPMLLDQGVSHVRIWEMSYSQHPNPQDLAIKEDGTYYNDKLFSGTYDMLPRDGAWWPCDTTYNVAIGKKGTVQDFEVIPYLHIVDFDADQAAQMATFLKSAPDNPPNNPIVLSMGEGSTLRVASESGMQIDIPASFLTYWGDLKLTVNKNLLLRLLNEGHTRLCIGENNTPFIAQGGIGRYLAMPLASHTPQVVQPQTQPKEEKEVNENSIPNVAAPLQPVAPIINTEPAAVNPLDELAAAIDEFKARLRAMFDESTLLSRKVKEVAFSQKQKERDFVQAKRALERIRMAI